MPVTGYSFLIDAPDATALSEGHDVERDVATSRVQIAKTGRFNDPRYGDFSITTKDFDSWERNFTTLAKDGGRLGLPVDIDHSPEREGKTESAGWIVALDRMGKVGKIPTPNELWATVEWNSLGQDLVGDRRYAYISPTYKEHYKDETGRTLGNTLVGVALTNRPFLSMAVVTLSRDVDFAEELPVDDPPLDSHSQMPDLRSNIIKTLGLAEDADEATILAAVTPKKDDPPSTKTLAQMAEAEGMVLLDSASVQKLTENALAGQEAAKTLSEMKFDTAFDAAVTKGTRVPAERESFKTLYALDSKSVLDILGNADAPKILSTDLSGSGAGGAAAEVTPDRDGFAIDEDRQAIHEKALTLSQERNIAYMDAVTLAVQGV